MYVKTSDTNIGPDTIDFIKAVMVRFCTFCEPEWPN